MPDRWLVILSGSRLTDELRSLPQDVMSFDEGANQVMLTFTVLFTHLNAHSMIPH